MIAKPSVITETPELEAAWQVLAQSGLSTEEAVALVERVTEVPDTWQPLQARLPFGQEDQALERVLLLLAAEVHARGIEQCPVPGSVKQRLRQEMQQFAKARKQQPLLIGTPAFVSGCKFATLRRFPAGPLDFEVSGLPRSWMLRVGWEAPKLVAYMTNHVGGLAPLFFTHVARPPYSRSLVLEREVMRTYYRIAQAMREQPQIKGLMTASWFHDPAMERERPHLEPLNRLYRDAGGVIVTMPAGEQTEADHPVSAREGIAVVARRDLLAWADAHAEFEDAPRATVNS